MKLFISSLDYQYLKVSVCRGYKNPLIIATVSRFSIEMAGPEPAVLDWHGHCGVKKLGGSGGILPQENF